MASHSVELDFMGQKISLKTESDAELVKEVSNLVRIKIQDVKNRDSRAAPLHVALLALFDLAEDYLRSKRKTASYRYSVNLKLDELVKNLESDLP